VEYIILPALLITIATAPSRKLKEMIAIIAKGKSVFEPNSKGDYSNSNYVLLSYILEEIYKQPYSVLVQTTIAKPLGLTYFEVK
jgi:CubicO group peptidase (beta-lactamase class C family)